MLVGHAASPSAANWRRTTANAVVRKWGVTMLIEAPFEDTAMAFSPDNQEWVRNEITRAIKAAVAPPGAFARRLRALRETGTIAAIWAVPIGMLAIISTLGLRVISDIKEEATFRARAEDRLATVERSLLALQAKLVANTPTDPGAQLEAKAILATARNQAIALPRPIVEDIGQRFITASASNQGAWEVAQEVLAYRTALNVSDRPPDKRSKQPFDFHFQFLDVQGRPLPLVVPSVSSVPRVYGAHWMPLGAVFPTTEFQPKWVFATGGAVSLDLQDIRQVVFDNVEVHYSGGPLILQNAIFINCRFVLSYVPKVQQFAEAVVSSTTVDFRS
jgi:hypothetical protein